MSKPAEGEPLPFAAEVAAEVDVIREWRPVFDKEDDLDGLLDAGTPLLGRAFSGRPRAPGRPG